MSMNDGETWIGELENWLGAVRGRVGLVGICFGHQVIASAFGEDVEKAPQGWGVGVNRYDLKAGGPFGDRPSLAGIASYQDQVTRLSPGARTIGGSTFTPHALFAYADGSAISIRSHQEFDAGFARELLAMSRAPDLGEEARAARLASLECKTNRKAVAAWISNYFTGWQVRR